MKRGGKSIPDRETVHANVLPGDRPDQGQVSAGGAQRRSVCVGWGVEFHWQGQGHAVGVPQTPQVSDNSLSPVAQPWSLPLPLELLLPRGLLAVAAFAPRQAQAKRGRWQGTIHLAEVPSRVVVLSGDIFGGPASRKAQGPGVGWGSNLRTLPLL